MDEINLNQPQPKQPEKSEPLKPYIATKQRKVWPWFVLLSLIIFVLAGYVGYYDVYPKYFKKTAETVDNEVKTETSVETNTDTAKTITATTNFDKVTDIGVTWATPKKLADQGLFTINTKYEGMGGCDSIDYYSVGTTSSGSEIIFAYANCSPQTNEVYRFVKRGSNYFLLKKNSSPSPVSEEDPYYGNKYSVDADFVLQSLLPDASITQGKSVLIYQYNSNIAYDSDFTSGDKLLDTRWGELYLESANTFI
mgnify:FL=1